MNKLTDVIVIDDCISEGYQRLIENELVSNKNPWYFQRDIVKTQTTLGTPGLSHFFFDANSGGVLSPELYNLVLPIVFESTEKLGIKPNGILQARSFMHFPIADALKKEYDHIHVDFDQEHIVCLYYVNNSDGDTLIFDKTTAEVPYGSDVDKYTFNIVDRITPKRGRCVFFNGDKYHASSGPSSDVRCIINFNLI